MWKVYKAEKATVGNYQKTPWGPIRAGEYFAKNFHGIGEDDARKSRVPATEIEGSGPAITGNPGRVEQLKRSKGRGKNNHA